MRRWYLVTVIIVLWCLSAGIGGFFLGRLIYFAVEQLDSRGYVTFTTVLQSPWWQFSTFLSLFAMAIAFPWGWARTKKLNSRLKDIYDRRESLLDEAQARRRSGE